MGAVQQGGNGNNSGNGGSTAFDGNRPITRATPGLQGETPGGATVVEVLEAVLYPAVPPAASLSIDNPTREIGQSTAYTLSWTATKNTAPISAITVDGIVETPTGNTQSGTEAGNLAAASGNYIKYMSVVAGGKTATANASVAYLPRMFWGITAKDGSGSPITDADIKALSGSELRSSRQKSFTNFGGSNQRIALAIPTSFGTASFKVNGLANTAFTKVRSNSDFVNVQGATVKMDVYLSNNLYNSPLDSFEII